MGGIEYEWQGYSRKNIFTISADKICIIGSRLTRNTTFFTRKLLLYIEPVAACNASLKKNQGNMPHTSHKINGKLSTGMDLKPT